MDALEALIGKNMNAHPDCLGIYIGVDEIYMAQTSKKNRGVVLESLVRVPVSGVDRSLLKPLDLNESFFAMDNWTESIAKVMAKKKWKTNRVVVSLAPAFCLLRHFVIPASIERKMWKESIPLQARKYIHFPFEKAEYAYHVYEFETATTKQKRLGVVFTMTTKQIVERLHKGLKSCGLELVSVEPSSLSLGRAFNDGDKEAIGNGGRIYSFFGKDMANFVFLNENAPVLLREVEVSGPIPAERRRFEITNCTEFIAKQLEKDPFDEAVLTGVDLDQWVSPLEADSKKPVRKWNLKEVYGIDMRSVGEVACVGASIKFYDQKTPDVDFTKGTRLSAYEFNASLTAWKVTLVVILVVLGLIGHGFWKVHTKAAELKRAEATHKVNVDDFKGLSGTQIQNNLNKIKSQNNNLQGLVTYRNKIIPWVEDMVNSLPAEMWVTKISYTDAFPGNNSEARSIVLDGFIKSGKKGTVDVSVGDKFQKTLSQQPTIKQICGDKVRISYGTIAGATGDKQKDTAPTSFHLTCSKAGGR